MATGGEPSSAFVEATGSEAVFDHACGPCSDEQTKEAVGFCVDCEDWLCDDCFRIHKRPKPSKHHVLMTTEEVKNSTQGLTVVDKCTEKCDKHDGKRIKYFCKEHDFLGCSKCVIENHGACKAQNIPDIAKDAAVKTDFQQTATDLEVIAKQSNELATDVKKKIALVKENKIDTVKAFRKYKKELVESLDKIEVALEDTCSKKAEEETERLEKIAETCGELEKASLQTKGQLEAYEDRGQHCNMFVAMVRSRNKVDTMRDSFRKARGLSGVALYTFQPNLKTGDILKQPEVVGTLVAKGQQRRSTDYSKIEAKLLADISVKSEGNHTCSISGSALLAGNKLVLTDYTNCEVKVIDTYHNKLMSKMKTDGEPWAVCKISDRSVAVTLCHRNRFVILSVDGTGKLATIKTITVSGECYGIATKDEQIILSCTSPNKVEIMDMNGSVLKTFGKSHQGQGIFAYPRYVSLSPDKKSVYVSDYSNNTVTCMSLDGTVTAVYKNDELDRPEQTAVDSNGMVYVSCYGSNNIHLITPDCKKIKVVLSASDGLNSVYSLSFCEESNRLYIGMNSCNVIKVFQLT